MPLGTAVFFLAVYVAAVAHSISPGPVGAAQGRWREQVHWIPVQDADGTPRLLYAQVCRPDSEAPARVVVIAHGSPPNEAERPAVRLAGCDREAMQWFLVRGYLVIAALRRGYGATGGAWAEGYGRCSDPDYAHAGLETARDLQASITYATNLPDARPDGVVVVGQSAGGWGAIALDSLPHPQVAALVNIAGGRGGRHNGVPNSNCRPDRLAETAGRLGVTASTPMLWIYAANDTYFSPEIADATHKAFTRAGGRAELVQRAAFGRDGHRLFFGTGGSAEWGPPLERYLARQLGAGGLGDGGNPRVP